MAKKLDYSSREYDDRLRQARRIGWNDDNMSSYERQKAIDNFDQVMDQYEPSDEVARIKKAARGEY